MFDSNKKKTKYQDNSTTEINRISKKTLFKGEIFSEGDFRIEGTVEGNLTTSGKVILGSEGKFLGNMKCKNADIEGFFEGYLEVKKSLYLKPSAKVLGDVLMESLTVEPGAVFNANCKMISTVKELNPIRVEGAK